jgi:hypothetical protein
MVVCPFSAFHDLTSSAVAQRPRVRRVFDAEARAVRHAVELGDVRVVEVEVVAQQRVAHRARVAGGGHRDLVGEDLLLRRGLLRGGRLRRGEGRELIPEAPLCQRALGLEPAALGRPVGRVGRRVRLNGRGGLPRGVVQQPVEERLLRVQKILKDVCDFRFRHLPSSFTPERLF